MSFTAQDVKALRDMTGAGMMDCKKALVDCNGDLDAAADFLRKQGIVKAGKKSDRVAAEGVVFSRASAQEVVLVELNCETDFVAKNPDFIKLGEDIAALAQAQKPSDITELSSLSLAGSTVKEKIASLTAVIGEKIDLRRVQNVTPRSGGKLGLYNHAGGKICVVMEVTGSKVSEELIKDFCMQVAAMNPQFVDASEVSSEILNKEREIALENLKDSGKPKEILDKIVAGQLNKFAAEISLNQQAFVKDPSGKKTVAQVLKEVDPTAKIIQFVRMAVGEGIEKKQDDFAAEVAKMSGQ